MTLVQVVESFLKLEKAFKNAKIVSAGLDIIRTELRNKIESLPIAEGNYADKRVLYYVLVDGEWFPAHGGEEITEGPNTGWLGFRTDYSNGACEGGPARPFSWAHADADGNVTYQWLDECEADAVLDQASQELFESLPTSASLPDAN